MVWCGCEKERKRKSRCALLLSPRVYGRVVILRMDGSGQELIVWAVREIGRSKHACMCMYAPENMENMKQVRMRRLWNAVNECLMKIGRRVVT